MKILKLLFLIIIFFPEILFAQRRSFNRHNDDFTILSIGPEVSGMAFLIQSKSNSWNNEFGYSLGGELNFRPVRPIGLTTGLEYNNIVKSIHYYSLPLLLNFFTENKMTFIGGPVLFSNANKDQISFQNQSTGGIIGLKTDNFGFYFIYNPKYTLVTKDTKNFIGILIKIDLQLKII